MFTESNLTMSSQLIEDNVLIDKINIYEVGEPETVGFDVIRPLHPHLIGFPALVQTTTLNNAIESAVESTYSIKVSQGVALEAGHVVEVTECVREPSLVGKRLLVDKVSQNGAAIVRKAVAHDFDNVNQEGKGGL